MDLPRTHLVVQKSMMTPRTEHSVAQIEQIAGNAAIAEETGPVPTARRVGHLLSCWIACSGRLIKCQLFTIFPLVRDGQCNGTADADFGQTEFGHPYLTDFGQSDFGQTDFGKKKLTDFGQP